MMETENKHHFFEILKKIDPLTLDNYTDDLWQLSYEEGIELTYIYVKELINRIPVDKKQKIRWLELNNKYRDAFLSNVRIHIFKTLTGSGKTVTSVMWVKFLTVLCSKIEGFVVLSAEYEHGTDEIERVIIKHGNDVKFVYFEGINRLCTQLNTKINKKGTTLEMLMKNGISISKYCENDCPVLIKCKYKCNCIQVIAPMEKGGVKNWIGVQHQIKYFLPLYLHHVDEIILIIDEEFSDAIKSHYKYGVPIFNKNIKFLNMVLKDLEPDVDESYKHFLEEFKELLIVFKSSIFAHLKGTITELNYDKIESILGNIGIAKGVDDIYVKKINACAYDYIKKGKIPPFKFVFGDIIDLIDNYEDLLNCNIENIDEWIKSAFFVKEAKISFLYYNRQSLKTLLGRKNILKIIINDATADKLQLEYLIGDIEPIQDHWEDWVYKNCETHQLKKQIQKNKHGRKFAHYGKYSFFHYPSSKSTFNFIMEDLRLILELHKDEPVFIGAREITGEEFKHINGGIALSDYVQTLGHPNVIFEEYPVKGTNKFSDINVGVVLMNAELPKAVVKRQAALCGMESDLYRETYSKNIITQFVGRIFRGGEHKHIYIIPGVKLPQLKKNNYNSYRSHTELNNYLKKQIKLKKEKEEHTTIINYLEKHNFITIDDCQKLLETTRYKANGLLKDLENKEILNSEDLRTSQKGRTKIIYNLKLE